MSILTISDFPAVRACIDVKLTESDLPDDVILEPIYRGAAESWVISRDAIAESRTGEDAEKVSRAAIFYLASLLVPAVARLTSVSVQTSDISYSRPPMDIPARVSELRALAESEISSLLAPESNTPERPTMFSRGRGSRGR